MKVSQLTEEQKKKIFAYRYDQIIEKHEGPENWDSVFRYDSPEFFSFEGYDFLLPLDQEHNKKITILRCIPSIDEKVLTIFLKDSTYSSDFDEIFTGFLAICEQVDGEKWYIATVYHEWFLTEYKKQGDS